MPNSTGGTDFQTTSIFGATQNSSALMPGEYNPAASQPDWGAIIGRGIVDTVGVAIAQATNSKFESGQLTYIPPQQAMTQMLLVVAVLYFVLKD